MPTSRPTRRRTALALLAALAALGGCGGGGGGEAPAGGDSCSVASQNAWLAAYFDDWYFWYRQAPRPEPAAFASTAAYFEARRYTGTDPVFPADRWSYEQSTADFNRTFGEGQALGYGVAVAGIEVGSDATQPLRVRYVEPASPAATAGVQRGDEVVSLNGRSAASVIAAQDFSALSAAQEGETLVLVLRRDGAQRTLTLRSAVYALTPVPLAAQRTSPGGRRVGVLQVQQMVSQALAGFGSAFAQFQAAGVQDLVLDLRYNGGGLVSTGATLAGHVAGVRGNGLAYAQLRFNDKHSASDSRYAFPLPAQALGLARVYVLAGPRTCSASEQVVAGLRGAGIEVVLVGDATCGKPVGFQPAANCGRTYSVVNFESVNQLGQGRYWDGLAASCAVPEDFSAAQNGPADPLLAAALQLADGGACPRSAPLGGRATARARWLRDGGSGPAEMLAR